MLASRRRSPVLILVTTMLLSTGCANFGYRPDAPEFKVAAAPCDRFATLAKYGQELQTAYHSRATLNRGMIYFAGAVLLGTAAATGGLGAAGGASLAIAVVSVSGGFTSGLLATFDNSTLANVYTASANQMAEGLANAEQKLEHKNGAKGFTDDSCTAAWNALNTELTEATTTLETARTNSAAGALIRARGELEEFEKLKKQLEDSDEDDDGPSPPDGGGGGGGGAAGAGGGGN